MLHFDCILTLHRKQTTPRINITQSDCNNHVRVFGFHVTGNYWRGQGVKLELIIKPSEVVVMGGRTLFVKVFVAGTVDFEFVMLFLFEFENPNS